MDGDTLMTILAIDADIVAYRSAFNAEKAVKWDEDLWTLWSSEEEATHFAIATITNIWESFKELTHDPIVTPVLCWSHKNNFRKKIWPEYKMNRKDQRKPLCLRRIRDRLGYVYQYNIEQDGYEADDIIGEFITCKDPYAKLWDVDEPVNTQNNRAVCVTIDKDLRTVPGLHYIDNKLVEITENEANLSWMCQTIAGDSVDNIIGVKGLGIKRAEKLLLNRIGDKEQWDVPPFDVKHMWDDVVLPTYEKHGYTNQQALLNARLTRIQREGDTTDLNGYKDLLLGVNYPTP